MAFLIPTSLVRLETLAVKLDDSMSLDEGLIWFAAPRMIAGAAFAGGLFGTVVHLSAPEWSRIYPIPPRTSP
jgi:hypothetical protein